MGSINAASVDLDPGTGGIQNTFSNAGGGLRVASSGVVTFTPALTTALPQSVAVLMIIKKHFQYGNH